MKTMRISKSVPCQWEDALYFFHEEDQIFWQKISAGKWEPETLSWMKKNIRPGDAFLDIGAWVGPTSFWARQLGAEVVALEPDPEAYKRLCFNMQKNRIRGMRAAPLALGASKGRAVLHSPRGLGKSVSRVDFSGQGGVSVQAIDWESLLKKIGKVDIVKMDIEGGEFHLLPKIAASVARNARALALSLHGPNIPEAQFWPLARELEAATKVFRKVTDASGKTLLWDDTTRALLQKRYLQIFLYA